MRVLHILSSPRLDQEAAAARALRLRAEGLDVELVTFARPLDRPEPAAGPRVHHLGVRFGGAVARRRRLVELLESRSPAVVHVDDPGHSDGAMAFELAQNHGLPVVLELRRIPSKAEATTMVAATRVIIPDPCLRAPLLDAGVRAAQIERQRLAHPGPVAASAVQGAARAPAEVRRAPGVGQRPLIVHASGLRGPVEASYLVQLAAALRRRDATFLLAVIATGAELRTLRAEARGTGLFGSHLVAAHPDGAIGAASLTAAADLAIVSGDRDRWIRATPQALSLLARGRPVALTWDDELSRAVEAFGAGFQLEADPEWAAFEAVRRLRQPRWRSDAGAAAYRLATDPELDPGPATRGLARIYLSARMSRVPDQITDRNLAA